MWKLKLELGWVSLDNKLTIESVFTNILLPLNGTLSKYKLKETRRLWLYAVHSIA